MTKKLNKYILTDMKVLWFTNTPCIGIDYLNNGNPQGGGWLYALSLALVDNKNIDLYIAYYSSTGVDSYIYRGIHFYPLFREKSTKAAGYILNSIKRFFIKRSDEKDVEQLRVLVENINPDIIHVHGTEDNFGLIAKYYPQKTIISIQGLINPLFHKLYSGFSKSDILSNEGLLKKITCTGILASEKQMRFQANREYEILSSCKYVLGRTFFDKFGTLAINPHRQYYVCDELLRPEFYHSKWVKKYDTSILSIVSTVSCGYYKGIETIYRTAVVLKKSKVNFKWTVIGLNEKDVQLTESITRESYKDLNIHLLGRKDAKDIINIVLGSDIYCQVSHIENSPNSLCEAMLLGAPIVATYAGGTASLLENNKEGLLVQDGDCFSIAGALIYLHKNKEITLAMSKAARARALERHSKERIVKELEHAYSEIIKNNK